MRISLFPFDNYCDVYLEKLTLDRFFDFAASHALELMSLVLNTAITEPL